MQHSSLDKGGQLELVRVVLFSVVSIFVVSCFCR